MNTDNNKKPLPVRNELVVGGILETAEETEDRKMRDMDSAPATAATAAATTNGKKQKQTAGISRGLRRNEEEWQAKRKALQEQRMAQAAMGTRGSAISKPGAVPSRNTIAKVFAGSSPASKNTPLVLNQGETPPQESPSLAASRDNYPNQQTPPPTNPASAIAHESLSGIGDAPLGGSSSYRPADSVMPTEITNHPEEQGVVTDETLMAGPNNTTSGNLLDPTVAQGELTEAQPVNAGEESSLAQAEEMDPEMLQRDEVKKRQEWCFKRVAGAIIIASVLVVITTVAFTQFKKDIQSEPTQMPSLSVSGSPSLAPTDLLQDFVLSLPSYTQESLENPWSPQALALAWLQDHPDLLTMPEWKKKDLFVLVTFYYSFAGDHWPKFATDNWATYDKDECYWFSSDFGYFDEEGNYVTEFGEGKRSYNVTPCNAEWRFEHLVLNQLGLNATEPNVPPEISLLTDLLTIDLGENEISSNLQEWLPTELFEMTQLEVLSLSANSFTGQIPTELGLLTSINRLHLPQNLLTGSLPSELFLLTALNQLYIYDDAITGSLPTELGLLTKMTELALLSNSFTGSLPSELGLLTLSVYLLLEHNELHGALPTEIGLLTNLWQFSIYSNRLTGSLPTELGLISNLMWLFLDDNALLGALPTELGLLTQIWQMILSENALTGSIPTELGLMSMPSHGIWLFDNKLTGPIPTELGFFSQLGDLRLGNNMLTGSLPSELGLWTYLTKLLLETNMLTGPIPSELGLLPNMTNLTFSDNSLTGSLPSELGLMTMLQLMGIIDLPFLSSTIPTELGLLAENYSLAELNISASYGLAGTIPGNLCGVIEFDCGYLLCGCNCTCQNDTVIRNETLLR